MGTKDTTQKRLEYFIVDLSHLTPSVKIAEAILTAPFDAKTRFSQKIVGRANTRRVQGAQEHRIFT